MSDLVFYTNPMSRGRIIRWMLEEIGQPYRTRILDFRGEHKSPDYLAINPMGKVPTIVHDGTVVTECAAICAYLADAFPQAGLAPATNDKARGDYYRWLFFGAGPLEAAVVNTVLKVEIPDDPQMRGMVGYGSLEAVLDTIEGVVAKTEHLAGDRFSAADLYVGAHLGWGMQFGTIPKRPAFEAYAGRLYARPAAVRAREIDDALIAEKAAASSS